MKKICLLVNTTKKFSFTNYLLFSNAFLKQKINPYLCLANSLFLQGIDVYGNCVRLNEPLSEGDSIDEERFEKVNLNKMDICWVLGFGNRNAFLDSIEILFFLSRKVKIVNSVESLIFLNNKYSIPFLCDHYPQTYASNNFDDLWDFYKGSKEKIWIVKPPAGSLGRSVYILKPNDINAKTILQSMTGHKNNKYCLLQEYIDGIENGEKRVLVCKDQIICSYKRTASTEDFRTNLHQDAIPTKCDLTEEEQNFLKKLGENLYNLGIIYSGIDMVYPYILEINIVNPGGLNTVIELGQQDHSKKVINLILDEI